MITNRIACGAHEVHVADAYPRVRDPTVQRNVREQDGDACPAISDKLPQPERIPHRTAGQRVWDLRAPVITSTFI